MHEDGGIIEAMSEPLRPLDAVEQRVLGTLIEKSLTTPDQYPLSLNATRVGSNQKTARVPVSDFDDRAIYGALGRLRELKLVTELSPADSRIAKYEHRLGSALDVRASGVALLGVLLLRGPQTAAELKINSFRLHAFDSTEALVEVLERLAGRGLVEELLRAPGQRETRFVHRLGPVVISDAVASDALPGDIDTLRAALDALSARVAALEAALVKPAD
jgi:uncharacterized protein